MNDSCKHLPTSIYRVEPYINPSTIIAVTSILKGCIYTNRSPQNTSISRVIELSRQQKVFVVGNYFKIIAAPINRLFPYSNNDDTSNETSILLFCNRISNAMSDDDYSPIHVFRSQFFLYSTNVISTTKFINTASQKPLSIFLSENHHQSILHTSPNDTIRLRSALGRVMKNTSKNKNLNSNVSSTSLYNINPGNNYIRRIIFTCIIS